MEQRFVIRDEKGLYYRGLRFMGCPVASTDRTHATAYTEEEIQRELPNGLGDGWEKEEVCLSS